MTLIHLERQLYQSRWQLYCLGHNYLTKVAPVSQFWRQLCHSRLQPTFLYDNNWWQLYYQDHNYGTHVDNYVIFDALRLTIKHSKWQSCHSKWRRWQRCYAFRQLCHRDQQSWWCLPMGTTISLIVITMPLFVTTLYFFMWFNENYYSNGQLCHTKWQLIVTGLTTLDYNYSTVDDNYAINSTTMAHARWLTILFPLTTILRIQFDNYYAPDDNYTTSDLNWVTPAEYLSFREHVDFWNFSIFFKGSS